MKDEIKSAAELTEKCRMTGKKDNRSKVTKILGGYGRTGRVLRTTFPVKIASLMSIKKGDRVRWEVVEPGHTFTKHTVVVTLFHRDPHTIRRNANFALRPTRKPQSSASTKSNDPYDELERVLPRASWLRKKDWVTICLPLVTFSMTAPA